MAKGLLGSRSSNRVWSAFRLAGSGCTCLLVLLSILPLLPYKSAAAPPIAAQDGATAPRIWQSENRTHEQLARDIAGLYLGLYNGGALPVKKVANPAGRTVSELMFEHGVFYGSYFPVELDALTCDLNPARCRREIVPASPDIRTSLDRHVAFSDPTPGKWTNAADDPLVLPYQTLERFTAYTPHFKSADGDLSDIVMRITRGCIAFDAACRADIERKNRLLPNPLDPNFEGELYLPTLAVRTDLTGDTASLRIRFADLDKLPLLRPALLISRLDFGFGSPPSLGEGPVAEVVEPQEVESGSREISPEEKNRILDRAMVRAVAKQVDSVIHRLFKFGIPSEASRSVTDRFQVLRLPFTHVDEYPRHLARRIDVAVLDERFDRSGCGFGTRLEILTKENTVLRSHGTDTCRPAYDHAAKFGTADHGTHVAGLIGASFDGEIIGINPFAHVLGIEFATDDIDSPISQRDLTERLEAADDQFRPEVFNMSFGWYRDPRQGGNADRVYEYIKANQNAALFVMAAGNDGVDLDVNCDLKPACYGDLPNVISVVGASRTGANVVRADRSNFSRRNFHLAAIGEDVVSIGPGGRLGRMSGTSQAAPQVAAAASLLMVTQRMPPYMVKQRLIACSNLDYGELGAMGGLLDVKCALRTEQDVVELLGGEEFDGFLHDVPPDGIFRFVALEGGPPRVFSKESVLGLVQQPNGSYTVFSTTDGRDVVAASDLLPTNDVVLRYRRFEAGSPGSGFPVEVRLSRLKRWVKRLNL